MKLPPLIFSRREDIIRWPEVNKRPYWFMWECKKKGVIKMSPYAECYSLSSLFLTVIMSEVEAKELQELNDFIQQYFYLIMFTNRKQQTFNYSSMSECN